MSLEDNKRLIQRLMEEGHNRRDAGAAAAFYTEDASNHLRTVGRAGMQAVFKTLYSVFPDFHYVIEECTAEGDRVVFVAGQPIGVRGTTNLMKLHRVGELASEGGEKF